MADLFLGDASPNAHVRPRADWPMPTPTAVWEWGAQTAAANLRLLEDTFSAMDEAVFLVSEQRGVVHASALARSLLDNRCSLRVKQDKLWHPNPAVLDRLSKAVATTLQTGCRSKMTVSLAWGETLSLDMTPANPVIFPSRNPLVFVRMRSNSALKQADAANLIATFEITKAEARVLAGLAEGLAPCELAAQNRVSEHTVRSHIANLKLKMDCGRIVDLVKLALLAQG